MSLTIGTHLGSHEITALLGKGGMGEVYRARDLKLKREVAIKTLPDVSMANCNFRWFIGAFPNGKFVPLTSATPSAATISGNVQYGV
jgi:hypothetical protein